MVARVVQRRHFPVNVDVGPYPVGSASRRSAVAKPIAWAPPLALRTGSHLRASVPHSRSVDDCLIRMCIQTQKSITESYSFISRAVFPAPVDISR